MVIDALPCLPAKAAHQADRRLHVPSLLRFLLILLVLAGLVYGGMLALVTFVEPVPRDMNQSVPASKFAK